MYRIQRNPFLRRNKLDKGLCSGLLEAYWTLVSLALQYVEQRLAQQLGRCGEFRGGGLPYSYFVREEKLTMIQYDVCVQTLHQIIEFQNIW